MVNHDVARLSRRGAAPASDARAGTVTLAQATWFWLKLGFISFGGPAGQIAIMHHELVERRRWISEGRFLHALNFCMVLPGPEAQQLATYVGWLMHRTRGALIAGGLFVLPSLCVLIALSWIYLSFGHLAFVAGIFYGIKPAVVALVVHAAARIGRRTLHHAALWALAAAAFVAMAWLQVSFVWIVGVAALIGALGGRWAPQLFTARAADHGRGTEHAPALIDDDTPTPAHARWSAWRCARTLAIGIGLWAGALLALAAWNGLHGLYTQMGWFFTKAALLTFGGAYAVLPYVVQGAVEQAHWLSAAQMIDGLALGETTPGPLIMVVAFVGYLGGASAHALGLQAVFWAGAVGACVASFFTFLPSFVFILAGGPFIESTHGDLRFTAPLTAITAAVVGVIVDLALFFALHVFAPHGVGARIDWSALLIAVAALVALFRFGRGVLEVIFVCGAIGLGLRLIGV